MPKVSIVMATYNRPELLKNTLRSFTMQKFKDYEIIIVDDGDDEDTPKIAEIHKQFHPDTSYYKLNRPQNGYKNQSRPLNVGIRRAKGEYTIIQNPECSHHTPGLIEKLTNRLTSNNVVFCRAMALDKDGLPEQWYCHEQHMRRPLFFCGGLATIHLQVLRGFDEDFQHYGFEDDDMARRLTMKGLEFEWTFLEVWHQWHPKWTAADYGNNQQVFKSKMHESIIRNTNREWGSL